MNTKYLIICESGDQMSGAAPDYYGPYNTMEETVAKLKEFREQDKYNDYFIIYPEQETT